MEWNNSRLALATEKEITKYISDLTKVINIESLKSRESESVNFVIFKMMEATDYIHSKLHQYSNLLDDTVGV